MFIVGVVPPEHKDKLTELYQLEWDFRVKNFPEFATLVNDPRYNSQLTNWTTSSIAAKKLFYEKALKSIKLLRRFEPKYDALTAKNAMLFESIIEKRVNYYSLNLDYLALGSVESYFQDAGPHVMIPQLVESTNFDVTRDYLDFIARLESVDAYINSRIKLLRNGMKQKMTQPLVIVSKIPDQIESLISPPVESSVMFVPFKRFPASIPPNEQSELIKNGKQVIENVVIPSFKRFAEFLKTEYIPACRTSISIYGLDKGKEIYAYLVKSVTNSIKTPAEIHELGLAEVARIRVQMKQIITDLGFNGRFYEFLQSLRNDTRFFAKTEEEFLDFTRGIAKRADPELPRLIGTLPRCTYGVKPIDTFKAPSAANSKYVPPSQDCKRPGIYYLNTFDLNSRPKYLYEGILLHGIGHHIQVSLAGEMDLPNFLLIDGGLTGDFVSYFEGWSLYMESLGNNIGFYSNPYTKFGSLGEEMLRAVRLVVDTGIHHLGWTRDAALDYTSTLAPISDVQAGIEVDRIISWPAQYMAHKLGEYKMQDLKRTAMETLKEKFDLRDYNSALLKEGPTTLTGLEEAIQRFIKSKQ